MLKREWNPSLELSPLEERILRSSKKQKLWRFLRESRHLLLDEQTRERLDQMYDLSGRGRDRVCPERLVLAMILQVACHVSDSQVPTLTAVDLRWRMVLDCLDEPLAQPLVSQGTVFNFRARAIESGLMSYLLEKTVALARETGGFGHKKLRVMIDSSPLLGAGRVEDTFNLIGRATAQLLEHAAREAGCEADELARELALTVASASSVKAALDLDWREEGARQAALDELLGQLERLRSWLAERFSAERLGAPPLCGALARVDALLEQDTEPDPDGPDGGRRIRRGGADRIISLSDPEMRHGRKSKSKGFAGYKRHVAVDAASPGLIVGVEVQAGNARESAGAAPLLSRLEAEGARVVELHVDRGYLSSSAVHERRAAGMEVITKPPTPARPRGGRFGKADFAIEVEGGTVTCPAGQSQPIKRVPSRTYAQFEGRPCLSCPLSSKCLPKSGRKIVTLHAHEAFHQEMARELSTPQGREKRRERIAVEHALARLGQVQGAKARYRGTKKNQAHTELAAAVANLHIVRRLVEQKSALRDAA